MIYGLLYVFIWMIQFVYIFIWNIYVLKYCLFEKVFTFTSKCFVSKITKQYFMSNFQRVLTQFSWNRSNGICEGEIYLGRKRLICVKKKKNADFFPLNCSLRLWRAADVWSIRIRKWIWIFEFSRTSQSDCRKIVFLKT